MAACLALPFLILLIRGCCRVVQVERERKKSKEWGQSWGILELVQKSCLSSPLKGFVGHERKLDVVFWL